MLYFQNFQAFVLWAYMHPHWQILLTYLGWGRGWHTDACVWAQPGSLHELALEAGEGYSWPEAPGSHLPSSLLQVAQWLLPSPREHSPRSRCWVQRERSLLKSCWEHGPSKPVAVCSSILWKDHGKCLTKVFKQPLSFLVICVGKRV